MPRYNDAIQEMAEHMARDEYPQPWSELPDGVQLYFYNRAFDWYFERLRESVK